MSEESVRKLRETNIARYGSYEAWKTSMRERAIKGGQKSKGSHLLGNTEKAKEIGRLGGLAKAQKRREQSS